ncbi:transaldolase [Pelagibaculum spongiae]|uniref:Transaldolase n=1 Tax=Pelagibaculum spongiae TaxID=2080658 RepID=A0A2V1GSE1_9GAMM|nr:transaldolase [Pelagibaculum spongiae]PVZ64311.1 transaldolase [Pelagibaculum spongiae]
MSKLQQISTQSKIVADTADVEAIKQHKPTDATTNPSLVLAYISKPENQTRIKNAIEKAKAQAGDKNAQLQYAQDWLATSIGAEITQIIEGRISTEVDARLSFDTEKTIAQGLRLIEHYKNHGVSSERVLIKVAATWQGIQAAAQLEKEGIHCNLTLVFHAAQAQACGERGITLISPFVGRILDWYKANTDVEYTAENDPGVISVSRIWQLYQQKGFTTEVMAASFRNTGEVEALSGCTCLTISPGLLSELSQSQDQPASQLNRELAPLEAMDTSNQASFTWLMNEDPMATEKLAEGIRKFAVDQRKLESLILASW